MQRGGPGTRPGAPGRPPYPHPSAPPAIARELKKFALQAPKNLLDLNNRIGPPEFYPIPEGAVEDLITQQTISDGFSEPLWFPDETGTLRTSFADDSYNIGEFRCRLLQGVQEIDWKRRSTPPARPTKKPEKPPKKNSYPNQIPPTGRNGPQWIDRLSGTEPLQKLADSVPHGYKEHNLLKTLRDRKIPLLRATWFIKVIYLNNRGKNQSLNLQKTWTPTLLQFFEQQFQDLIKTKKQVARQGFNYVVNLMSWNYHEGLLHQELLFTKLISYFHEFNKVEESILLSPILLEYLPDMCRTAKPVVRQLISYFIEKIPQFMENLAKSGEEPRFKLRENLPQAQLKLWLSLRNILRYLILEASDSLTESNTSQTLLNVASVPIPIDKADEDLIYEEMWKQNKQDIQQLQKIPNSNSSSNTFGCAPVDPLRSDVIGEMDNFIDSLDLSQLYSKIFPESRNQGNGVPDGNSISKSSNNDESNIMLICEWAVTTFRSGNCRSLLVSSLLSRYVKSNQKGSDNGKGKPAIQQILTRFLDEYVPKSNEELRQIDYFFGELIRVGLFSHDFYVRNLISRGILESKQDQLLLQQTTLHHHYHYLKNFPITDDNELNKSKNSLSSSAHEINQRRVTLKSLGDFDEGEVDIEKIKSKILKSLEAISSQNIYDAEEFKDLEQQSRFCQVAIGFWILSNIKKAFQAQDQPGGANSLFRIWSNSNLFFYVIKLFESAGDLPDLTDLLLWIFKEQRDHSLTFFMISAIYRFRYVYLCRDQVTQLLDVVYQKCLSAPDSSILHEFLFDFIKSHEKLTSIQQWIQSTHVDINQFFKKKASRVSFSPPEILLGQSFQSFKNQLQPIIAVLQDRTSTLPQILQITFDTASKIESNTPEGNLSWILPFFERLSADSAAIAPNLHKIFLILIRDKILPELKSNPDPSKSNLLIELIKSSIVRQFMDSTLIFSELITPFFSEIVKQILDPMSVGSVDLYLKLLENFIQVQDQNLESSIISWPIALSLLLGLISLYNKLLHSADFASKSDLLDRIRNIFKSQIIKKVCSNHNYELAQHISHENKPLMMEIFGYLLDKEEGVNLSHCDGTSESLIPTVQAILSEIDKWTVRTNWYDLYVFLQKFPEKLSCEIMVSSLLKQLHNEFDVVVNFKILTFLGPEIQAEFLEQIRNVLSTADVLLGNVSLPEYMRSLLTGEIDIMEISEESTPPSYHQNFLSLVTTCLSNSSVEQKNLFANTLLANFSLLVDNMLIVNMDILENSPKVSLQDCLQLRLDLLVPLIPHILANKKTCNFDDLALTLLSFLGLPLLQASNEEFFSYLVSILSSLLNEPPNSKVDPQMRQLQEKLKKKYDEMNLTARDKTRIEQSLPFFQDRQPSVVTGPNPVSANPTNVLDARSKRSLDPWTLLEDYNEAPLSPTSSFGAEKIEKKKLMYGDIFERKKRKV